MVGEHMINITCASCASENIWLESVSIDKENPALIRAVIMCDDCKRIDHAGCRTDYLIWFLYKLLPEYQVRPFRRSLALTKANAESDGGDGGAA